MLKNKKGFSLIELIVVIAILVVFAAILIPNLIQHTEQSRAQKDESAMDEVVNAVQLALADQDCFDEMLQYSCSNNFITYSDSTGDYASQMVDGEFWAPDGAGRATTITFNPIQGQNNTTIYSMDSAIVNDMTYGNGSVAHDRVMQNALINNNQCYLKNASINNNSTGYTYNKLRQTVGDNIVSTSQTYRNSSFTIFIQFKQKDGVTVAEVNGQFNGTNLYDGAPAAIGSETTEYEKETGTPIISVTNPGTTTSNITSSALSGGGSFSPDYKQNENKNETIVDSSLTFSIYLHCRYNFGGNFCIKKDVYAKYDNIYFICTDSNGIETKMTDLLEGNGSFIGVVLEIPTPKSVDEYDIQIFAEKDGKTYAGQKVENWSVVQQLIKTKPSDTVSQEWKAASIAYITYAQTRFNHKTENLAINMAPQWILDIINNHQSSTIMLDVNDESGYDIQLSDRPYFKLDTTSTYGFTFKSTTTWDDSTYAIVKYEGLTKRFDVKHVEQDGKVYKTYGRFEIEDVWPNHGMLPIEVTLYNGNGQQISTTYKFTPISTASQICDEMVWYIQTSYNKQGIIKR